MDRRRFLGAVAGTSLVAGCTGGGSETAETTQKDSDGDGVPDSEDYAPKDPDVQSKSDLQTVAKTSATATTRTSSEPETTTATTTTATTRPPASDSTTSRSSYPAGPTSTRCPRKTSPSSTRATPSS